MSVLGLSRLVVAMTSAMSRLCLRLVEQLL